MHRNEPPTPSGSWPRWALPGLLLGTVVICFTGLGAAGLYDPADGLYAEVAREMVVLRDWLTPRLDFVRYFEKPPLLYWLNAAAIEAFGPTQFAAHLATALAAVAGVGFTYGIGRGLWGRRAGIAGGAVLATSLGYFIFGRVGLPDMLFVASLTAAFLGFARGLLDDAPRPGAVVGAYAAMALAVLAKGLIGVVFPALTLGGFVVLTRDWRILRRMEILRGGAVFLLIAAPWHILAGIANPGFFRFYFVNEHLLRFLGRREPIDYATLPVALYLGIAAIWFFPWVVFLPVAIRRCWPGCRPASKEERGGLFVLLWAAAVIGFFAVCQSRQEHYSLPALPALALCVGRLWAAVPAAGDRPPWSRVLMASWVALAVVAAALVPVSYLFGRLEHHAFYNLFRGDGSADPPLPPAAMASMRINLDPAFGAMIPLFRAVGATLGAGAAAAAALWLRLRPRAAVATLVGTLAVFLLVLQHGFVVFTPQRSIAPLAAVARDEIRSGDQIVVDGPYGAFAGVDFYTGRPAMVLNGRAADLLFGSRYPEAAPVFVDDRQFAAIWRGPGRVFFFTNRADRLGLLRALSPTTLVLGRTAQNWLLANRP